MVDICKNKESLDSFSNSPAYNITWVWLYAMDRKATRQQVRAGSKNPAGIEPAGFLVKIHLFVVTHCPTYCAKLNVLNKIGRIIRTTPAAA